jgi:pheromone shutdown protein TraB
MLLLITCRSSFITSAMINEVSRRSRRVVEEVVGIGGVEGVGLLCQKENKKGQTIQSNKKLKSPKI